MTDQKMTTRRLNDMGLGFMHASALVTGIELGVFSPRAPMWCCSCGNGSTRIA